MQAARLLEPRPRTLRSKLIEIARAVQLEARYGRQGVLDIWLTLAPFGGNLEGVRAGSLAWFGRAAGRAGTGAGRPVGRHPAPAGTPAPGPPRRRGTARARDRVLAVGVRAGLFDADGHARADRPRAAAPPRARNSRHSLPRTPLVRTTLDLPLQAALERLGQRATGNACRNVPRSRMLVADAARARDPRAVSRRLARSGPGRRAST